jgi:hypothetical protein
MLGSTILDVAIGMSLVYLLFSLICSAIGELIEGLVKNRAADLERGIRELLSDRDGSNSVTALYNHPLIYSLFSGSYDEAKKTKWWRLGASDLPSYIPSANFALALMDIALPGTVAQVSGAAGATPASAASSPAEVIVNNPPDPAPAIPPQPAILPNSHISALRTAVFASQNLNAKTKQALVTLIDAAGKDVSKVRENIEGWFNSSMERVSGWYKRRSQVIIFCTALVAAVLVNVDSVVIINTLSTNPAVRDAVVAAAQNQAGKGGTPQNAIPADASAAKPCSNNSQSPDCKITESIGQLKALGIPIGWTREPFDENERGYPRTPGAWLLKLTGFMITAFAACLGAPFWFDTLSKFITVRSSVKPKEKSPQKKSQS